MSASNSAISADYAFRLKNSSVIYVTGDFNLADKKAFDLCKKESNFFERAVLISREKNLLSSDESYYNCSILENDDEAKRPTSIEQRVLQTRLINKPAMEIYKSVASFAKDNGYGLLGPMITTTLFKPKSDEFANDFQRALIIEFEVTAKDSSTSFLRLRTFSQDRQNKTEVFSKKKYQYFFDQIAQQLFTEAIPLEPSELN